MKQRNDDEPTDGNQAAVLVWDEAQGDFVEPSAKLAVEYYSDGFRVVLDAGQQADQACEPNVFFERFREESKEGWRMFIHVDDGDPVMLVELTKDMLAICNTDGEGWVKCPVSYTPPTLTGPETPS